MTSPLIWNIGEFILACTALGTCAHILMRSLITIARFLRISEFASAFIIMASATSLPELFVGITSSLEGKPTLALGTVIGSNILDLTLIIGIALLVARHVRISSKEIKHDALLMVAISILPLGLMSIGKELSRLDGLILISIFLLYQYLILTKSKRYTKPLKEPVSNASAIMASSILLITIIGLYLASDWAVRGAITLSDTIGMPPILIGLIMLSLGTSIPELAFETTSALKGHGDLALGDVIGSVITNSTLVLGVAAVIHPISNNFFLFLTSAGFMAAVAVIFAAFTESNHLTWRVGAGLILLYVFFLIVELQLKGVVI